MKHNYIDGLFNKRIMILGPLPPPLGGVSVHVQRVISLLLKQNNQVKHVNTCVEYRYRFFIFYMLHLLISLVRFRPDEVHLHTLYLSNALAELTWIMRMKKILHYEVILIEHDCRYLYTKSTRWKERLNLFLPRIKKLVCIGNVTAKSYRDNDMMIAQSNTIEVAFLPPDQTEEQDILKSYPQELFTFIATHKPLFLANAFQLSLLEGKDLYGFDQCLQVLQQLKDVFPTIGCILVLGQIGDKVYYDRIIATIKSNKLEHHCYILIGQHQLWPLLRLVDLFVRPTRSDGASVSIEEALWVAKPVVASNVCHRPEGVAVYDIHDSNALYKELLMMLDKEKCIAIKSVDFEDMPDLA